MPTISKCEYEINFYLSCRVVCQANSFPLVQEIAEQAAARAQGLPQAGEDLQFSIDQGLQLQEIAYLRGELERVKAKSAGQIDRLQEKNQILQEKNKNLAKSHKGQSLLALLLIVEKQSKVCFVVCIGTHFVLCSYRTQKFVSNKRRSGDRSDESCVPSNR